MGAPGGANNLLGQQVGRYLVGHRLGTGGMTIVYQAYDQVQGRSVALKVLSPGSDVVARARFHQEARTAANLHHPHIVRTIQVGSAPADGIAYIAMELVEGESLGRLLERQGQFSPGESCNLLEPIARSLAYAHRSGVIHRDVKPSNILLRPASPGSPNSVQLESLDHPVIPLLSDFGIAKALDMPELTSAGRTIGTPAYMAPEQCAGSHDIDGRADLYALGAVLYRCLVGRPPFGGTTTQILYAHVYEPVTIPDDVLANLPPLVVGILRKSLAKEPAQRYGRAEQLANDLALAAGRRPVVDQEVMAAAASHEATATLTLSSLPPVSMAPPATRTSTVLIPAPPGASDNDASGKAGTEYGVRLVSVPPTGDPSRETGRPAPRRPAWFDRIGPTVAGAAAVAAVVLLLAVASSFLPLPGLPTDAATPAQVAGNSGVASLAMAGSDETATPTTTMTTTAAVAGSSAGVSEATPLAEGTPSALGGPDGEEAAAVEEEPSLSPTHAVGRGDGQVEGESATPTPDLAIVPTFTPAETPETPISTQEPEPDELTPDPEEATSTPEPEEDMPAPDPDAGTPTPDPEALPTPGPEATPELPEVLACSYTVDPLFRDFYNRDAATATALGCPNNVAIPLTAELQTFQQGYMLRRNDRPHIYVRYGNGQWEQSPNTWEEGMPLRSEDPHLAPPGPGLIQPERGFGKLWAEDAHMRDALGWATSEPEVFPALVQSFDGGLVFGNQENSDIDVFLRSDLRL